MRVSLEDAPPPMPGKTLIVYLDDGSRVYAKHTEAPLLDQYMMETMLEAVREEAIADPDNQNCPHCHCLSCAGVP